MKYYLNMNLFVFLVTFIFIELYFKPSFFFNKMKIKNLQKPLNIV